MEKEKKKYTAPLIEVVITEEVCTDINGSKTDDDDNWGDAKRNNTFTDDDDDAGGGRIHKTVWDAWEEDE